MYFAVTDSLSPETVEPLLRGRLGRPYEHVISTPSTQLLLPPEAPEGALAAADEQTAARAKPARPEGGIASDASRRVLVR